MGGMGIFEFPSFINPDTGSFDDVIVAAIGVVIAMIIAFILTLILWKDEQPKEASESTEKTAAPAQKELLEREAIAMPLEGKVVPLSDVQDAAFSAGAMGKGLAIDPSKGIVTSPVNGTIETLFPTKHAIGIVSESGIEVLIHVGMDTVQLNGEHFETFVNQGDTVKIGQKLLSFDMEKIQAAGYSLVTPIVIANTDDYLDIVPSGLENPKEFLTIVR